MVRVVLAVLILAGPALAVDTLKVQTIQAGEWTTFVFDQPFADASFVNMARAPFGARDGSVWWGLNDGAVRFDGTAWVKYTVRDGLMDGAVLSIAQAEDGALYFAGRHWGKAAVTRYDPSTGSGRGGKTWRVFTEADGLVGEWVGGGRCIDSRGNLWLTTEHTALEPALGSRRRGGFGALRFDGRTWDKIGTEEGLVHNRVYDIAAGPDGSVWFATVEGISRFDPSTLLRAGGTTWKSYEKKDGLLERKVYRVWVTQDGKVWCTHGNRGGISVLDGTTWTYHTEASGMPVGYVRAIFQSRDGAMWLGTHPDDFGTYGVSGLLRYQDGVWLRIIQKDGLPGDSVFGISQDRDGAMWLVVPKAGLAQDPSKVPDVALVRYRPDFTLLCAVSGSVRRADGSPWAGAPIRVEDLKGQVRAGAKTGADGQYQVRAFPGTYRVSVLHGEGTQPVQVTLKAGGEVRGIDFAPSRIRPPIATGPFRVGLSTLALGVLLSGVLLSRYYRRLREVLFSPGKAFREVAQEPDWGGPFHVVLVATLMVSCAVIGRMVWEMVHAGGGTYKAFVIPLFLLPVILAFWVGIWVAQAGLIWFIARICGERIPYSPTLSATGYALVPQLLLGGAVLACVIFVKGFEDWGFWRAMPTSLGRMFPGLAGPHAMLQALMNDIEVFTLWTIGLTALGVQRVCECRMSKAVLISLLCWIMSTAATIQFLGNP